MNMQLPPPTPAQQAQYQKLIQSGYEPQHILRSPSGDYILDPEALDRDVYERSEDSD